MNKNKHITKVLTEEEEEEESLFVRHVITPEIFVEEYNFSTVYM